VLLSALISNPGLSILHRILWELVVVCCIDFGLDPISCTAQGVHAWILLLPPAIIFSFPIRTDPLVNTPLFDAVGSAASIDTSLSIDPSLANRLFYQLDRCDSSRVDEASRWWGTSSFLFFYRLIHYYLSSSNTTLPPNDSCHPSLPLDTLVLIALLLSPSILILLSSCIMTCCCCWHTRRLLVSCRSWY